MRKFHFWIILLSITIFNCSNDNSTGSNVNNGFLVNGVFYKTPIIAISRVYKLREGTVLDLEIRLVSNLSSDYLGSFYLYPDATSRNRQLITGTYTTSSSNTFTSPGKPLNVSEDIVQFRDNSNVETLLSTYSARNSGSVTINSITNVLDDDDYYRTTYIDMDYTSGRVKRL